MSDPDLLKYFMDESNKKFDELKSEILKLNGRLEDLQSFKIEMIASSRWVSMLVSTACGLLSFGGSLWIAISFKGH